MCWESNKSPVKRIAKKYIYVYKIVESIDNFNCISAVKYFKYQYNKIYTQENFQENFITFYSKGNLWTIEKGFHSYKTFLKAKADYQKLHNDYYIIVQCIIPKGSTFFENENGEVVSDSIVISNSFRNSFRSYLVYKERLSLLIIGTLLGIMLSAIIRYILLN